MTDRNVRQGRYYVRRPQAAPYVKPGVWPSVGAMLLDVGLAVLFWVGLLAGLAWLVTR